MAYTGTQGSPLLSVNVGVSPWYDFVVASSQQNKSI